MKALFGWEFYAGIQIKCPKERHGGLYGGWDICPDLLESSSVVYSFGIGEDISFDLSLIENFGVTIHAFDPTPRSLLWVSRQQRPTEFRLYEIGLAAIDGQAEFHMPRNPNHVSCTVIRGPEYEEESIKVPVNTISTIMRNLNHARVDLMKMDIEGSEYDVIADIVKYRVQIKQLLVEFHHRFLIDGVARTRNSIRDLNNAGYRIFSISDNFEEISFLNLSI